MRTTKLSRGIRVALIAGTLLASSVPPFPAAEPVGPVDQDTLVRGEVYALLMEALLAQRRGEYRNAAADVRRAIELRPDDPALLTQGAVLLERMGRLKDSEDLARRALTVDPDHIDALWFVADHAAALALGADKPDPKHREEALALYQRMIELGVEDAELMRKVVNLKLSAGDQTGALTAARELVAQRPGDRQAVGMLAQLLLDGGDARGALRVLVSYVAEHPNDSALIRLAEELARNLDAWDIVEEAFAEGKALEGQPVEAQRLLGQALLRLDRVEPASRALEQVLLTDPEDRNARFHLARTYRRMGRLGEAAALAQALAAEVPADRGTHLLLAEILDDQGDTEGALNAYNTSLRLSADPKDPHAAEIREAVRRRMIMLYLASGQNAAALTLFERMESPSSPETLEARGRLAAAEEDWNDVRQTIRELRAAGATTVAALLEAELFLRTDRAPRATAKIEEAVGAGGPAARVRAAVLYHEAGLLQEGERLLREWVANEPESTDARFQLGAYLYQDGRFDEADREMREVFRLDADHAQALNFVGYGHAERGKNLEEALVLVSRAVELDPWNGAYLDSLGWIYFMMGRYGEARQPLEQAARTFPHDPTVLDHLGDLYGKLGERDLAVAAWTRALDAGSSDAPALRAKIDVFDVGGPSDERANKPETAEDPRAPKAQPRRP